MRFLLDIPIGRATAEHLLSQGHDCVLVRNRLAATASDPEIVRCGAAERRIVLCFDLDIGTLVALSGETLPSVITFRTTRQSADYLNQRLDAILPEIEQELERGALATVEDDRVRLRMLPITRK